MRACMWWELRALYMLEHAVRWRRPGVDENGRAAVYMRKQGCQHMPSGTTLGNQP